MTGFKVHRQIKPIIVALAAGLATGCASIVSGTSQNVNVETNPSGAACELSRQGQVVARVSSTPGSVNLEKTKHDVRVVCEKEGYEQATAVLESGVESATFGNIILGGGIGWAVDSAAGADNKYPENITLPMVPLPPEQSPDPADQSSSSRAPLRPRAPGADLTS